MTITNCKVNHLTNPLGYALKGTTFSWTVEQSRGKCQTAARIVVKLGNTVEADTGWAELDSLAAPVEVPLRPRTRYTWTVCVRTDAGEEAASGENWFETGKLDEPWAAGWIGCDDSQPRHPVFSREITPSRPVAAARLYVCGLGLYECAWNGEKVGGEYLTPYCTDYNSWVQYQTYDVTQQLQTAGTLSVTLGNGWYKGRFGFDRQEKPYYGDSWKLLAELRLTYTDGRSEVIGTDEGWTVTRSNITFSTLYDGERRDDTLQPLPPERARLVELPAGVLTERYSTQVTVREEPRNGAGLGPESGGYFPPAVPCAQRPNRPPPVRGDFAGRELLPGQPAHCQGGVCLRLRRRRTRHCTPIYLLWLPLREGGGPPGLEAGGFHGAGSVL